MSSTTTSSARRILLIALLTVSSARCRRISPPRSSRVNQATCRPCSTASCPSASSRNVFPVPGRPADDEVLLAVQPFQGPQRLLRRRRDRRRFGFPGVERLPGRERRPGPAGRQGGPVPAGDLGGEQGAQDLDGFPALRAGGGQHLGGGGPGVRHPQPAEQGVHVLGQRRRGRHPGRRRPGPRSRWWWSSVVLQVVRRLLVGGRLVGGAGGGRCGGRRRGWVGSGWRRGRPSRRCPG